MKRQFTEQEIQQAIQKSAEHCAYIMTHAVNIRTHGEWTAEKLVEDLKNGGGTRVTPFSQSFSSIGTANSLSMRLDALKDAIHGSPRQQWLHYWTKGE